MNNSASSDNPKSNSELKPNKQNTKVWKTTDIGHGFQSVKGFISFRSINKIYAKIKIEYRFERIFWFVSRALLPLLIFVLFLTSVIGISLNFASVTEKVVRFAPSSSSQNIIEIPINMHEWAIRCNKEHYINETIGNRYIFNVSITPTKSTIKMWNDIGTQFNQLTAKIKKIAIKHHLVVNRQKNSNFKKYDFPTTLQKILNKGIDFYSLQMKYYKPAEEKLNNSSNITLRQPVDFFNNLYIIPIEFRNNIVDNSILLPTPTLILNLDCYFKYFSGDSDFVTSFKTEVKKLMKNIANNKNSSLNNNCFGNANFINTRINQNSNITSILPIFNISPTAHNQAISYFKNSMIAILIIFVILLIYLLFRYGINNVCTILCAGVGLLLLLFSILTLVVPIALSAYTILILIILLFLFNAGFFIHQAAEHISAYEKNSRFVFAKKNDIKKIAFDILMRMKKIILLQLVAFGGLGIMLAIGYALPFFQAGLVHELIGYGVTLCLSILAMGLLFVFGFIYVWINVTYFYLNFKKTQVINSILYRSVINNEQEILDINNYWAEINIKQLIYLNPEIKSIINVNYGNDPQQDNKKVKSKTTASDKLKLDKKGKVSNNKPKIEEKTSIINKTVENQQTINQENSKTEITEIMQNEQEIGHENSEIFSDQEIDFGISKPKQQIVVARIKDEKKDEKPTSNKRAKETKAK